MGTEHNRQLEQPEGQPDSKASAGGTATGGNNSGGNSSTASTASGRGTAGNSDRGIGGGTATGTAKEKELPELALLTEEEKQIYLSGDKDEQKRVMHNARKRARYAKNKEQTTGEAPKPRKVNNSKGKSKAKAEAPIDVTQLNLIFMGLSTAVASRPNCEHWLLTEQEINSITVPLSKMLAESTIFSGMGEYSNQIALVMACVTVFAPRLLLTVQKTKEVKRNARTGQSTDTNVKRVPEGRAPQQEKRSNSKSDNRDELKPSSNGTADVKSVPFYGVPIC